MMTDKIVETRPVFVCGVGRSGTSLVQSMLATHSCLAFPPETSFLRRLIATGSIAHALTRGGEAECLNLLDSDKRIRRTGIKGQELFKRARADGVVTGGSLYKALLCLYADHHGKRSYGDKDPRAIEYLELVAKILPGVQVIHIVRDPRDVLVSKKKAEWSRSRGSLHHIFANYIQMKIGRSQGPRLFHGNYHELVYEALIEEPEEILQILCQQLGLGYESDMLEFAETAKELVSDSELSWKKETLGPILRGNSNKWKDSLSDWEVSLTELLCVEAFNAGGYKTSCSVRKLNFIEYVGVHTVAIAMRMLGWMYRLYRDRALVSSRKYL